MGFCEGDKKGILEGTLSMVGIDCAGKKDQGNF